MGLTNKKEDQLREMPIIKAKVHKSKDEKYLVHTTTITTIKPLEYYKAVINGKPKELEPENEEVKDN